MLEKVHIGTSWQILLNRPCVVKLFSGLVIITTAVHECMHVDSYSSVSSFFDPKMMTLTMAMMTKRPHLSQYTASNVV